MSLAELLAKHQEVYSENGEIYHDCCSCDDESLPRYSMYVTGGPTFDEVRDAYVDHLASVITEFLSPKGGWVVVNNITGLPVSKVWPAEDQAVFLCGSMNLNAGPGGLYGIRRVQS